MQETIEGLQEIRELAAQFAAERLRPNVERWDHERAVDENALAQLAELGFHGMLVPEAHGGGATKPGKQPRATKLISMRQASNIMEAVSFAKSIELPLVAHLTVHWSLTDVGG